MQPWQRTVPTYQGTIQHLTNPIREGLYLWHTRSKSILYTLCCTWLEWPQAWQCQPVTIVVYISDTSTARISQAWFSLMQKRNFPEQTFARILLDTTTPPLLHCWCFCREQESRASKNLACLRLPLLYHTYFYFYLELASVANLPPPAFDVPPIASSLMFLPEGDKASPWLVCEKSCLPTPLSLFRTLHSKQISGYSLPASDVAQGTRNIIVYMLPWGKETPSWFRFFFFFCSLS